MFQKKKICCFHFKLQIQVNIKIHVFKEKREKSVFLGFISKLGLTGKRKMFFSFICLIELLIQFFFSFKKKLNFETSSGRKQAQRKAKKTVKLVIRDRRAFPSPQEFSILLEFRTPNLCFCLFIFLVCDQNFIIFQV